MFLFSPRRVMSATDKLTTFKSHLETLISGSDFNLLENYVNQLAWVNLALTTAIKSDSSVTSWQPYQNLRESASAVIKTGYGKVFALTVHNKASETRWIQLYDSNAAIDGLKPKETHPIFANNYLVLDSNYFGYNTEFEEGIAFGFSIESKQFVPALASDMELHLKYQ